MIHLYQPVHCLKNLIVTIEGVQQSVLQRVPMPQVDWENPVPENMPDYLASAFPFIFRSGDACPYQPRPVDIKLPN